MALFARSSALIVILVLLGCLALPAQADVRWKSGAVTAAEPMQPAELSERMAQLMSREEQTRVVLQFGSPVDSARRSDLERQGISLLSPLGEYSWFARLTPGSDVRNIGARTGIVRAEAIATEHKLDPDLAAGILRPWAEIRTPTKSGKPAAAPQSDPTAAVYVFFHSDVDATAQAASLLAGYRGKVQSVMRSINAVVAHLPFDRVADLAADDNVMYVETPLPALTEVNDSNRALMGADTAQAPPYGLDGAGVTVLVYDGGQMFAHGDFGSRLTIGTSDTAGISDHATHVGGTIGGDGSGSAGQYKGMAPAVDFVSYGFEVEGGLVQGFLYTDPGDLEADYTEAINLHGADLSNNSIGTNTAPNGFPCDWEGNYGATGALIDAIVSGSLGSPFRIVWANGNERGSGACGSTYLTTAPPACAKNHITVGAMNSNDDSVTDFTSWGPCDDGRLKPDISGPGCESGGDSGVTSTNSSGGYNVKCGTSMASPSVAGASALLLQHYRANFPGDPDFRNSTLKAILATTATDLETAGPDYKSGYGSVRILPAADLIEEQRFVEAEVAQSEVYALIVVVGATDTELKVTLAWDDPAGTPNVNPVLVNDLDLRVIDSGGTTYWPWTLDPANPATAAVRTVRDSVNNIEQVVIDNPAPGAYRIEIEGFNIAQNPTQPFSVAASPSLINCAPAGSLGTDVSRISCQADLGLRVIDCDLNTDDGLIETVNISVVSDTEPAGESVTLTETAAESAAFIGALSVDTTDATGTLHVAEGDTITVTYVDADDGDGGINVPVVRNVAVDCTSPSITSVSVTQVNPRDATATVDLDEQARVTAHFGLVCGVAEDSTVSFALQTQHDVQMTGLTDETTYFFTIEATDEAGNVTVDDNGGACYGFTTPQVPDFFTEQFTTGLDLAGQSASFEPIATIDQYSLCTEPAPGGFPTDPSGGTVLSLADDQPGSFVLNGGEMVTLYGESYGTVYVGPNGYLTFGSGDSDYTETFADHFAFPRVAALFDDLNPSSSGTVSWKQLSDRVAVTWEDVPEYSTSNTNNFQIEMFFDGRIRITWVQLDVQDAIAGLSAGSGLDPDFLATDLTAALGCGPRPPAVQDLSLQTAVDTPIAVALLAIDDGLPAPAGLTYSVIRLPEYGSLLDDGNAQPIVALPHDLVGGGNSVTYTPAAGAQGYDSFDYRADDGGTAPDGGSSGIAVAGIGIGGGTSAVYEFLVDDSDPGWSTTGAWAFGQPTGAGSHNGDPTSGATGLNVLGYELTGDYTDNMVEEYLTSTSIDLSSVSGTTLEFQRWLGIESASYDHARVELSTDGASWTTIWDHTGGATDENAWSAASYDISSLADGQPDVTLRFSMGVTDGSVTYPGWNIDDLRITALTPGSCSSAPAEIHSVRIDSDLQTVRWAAASYSGGSVPVYDVLRSGTASDFGIGTTCLESDDGADTLALDVQQPAAGQLFFYLVRAENECGAGSLGGGRSGQACTP